MTHLPGLTHSAESELVTLASVPHPLAQSEISNCLEKSQSNGEVATSLVSMVNYPHWLIMFINSLQLQQDGYGFFFLLNLVSLSLSFTFLKMEVINKEPDHPLM